jgi:hypothetical protein
MLRTTLSVLLLSLSALALGACTKEEPSSDDDNSSDDSTNDDNKKSSKDATEAEGDDDDDSKASVGPNCTAYLECCDELAEDQPSVAQSCDTTRKAIDDAVESGAAVESYETACKSAVSSWKSAGYCK